MMAVEKRYVKISPFDLDKWTMETDPGTGRRTYTLGEGHDPVTVTISKPQGDTPAGESAQQDHVIGPGGKVVVGNGDATVVA